MSKHLEIGIVESNYLVLEGLKRIFSESAFKVAFECRSVEEIWELDPPAENIAGLLIDVGQEEYPCDEDIARLRGEFPESRIILMAESSDQVNVAHAIDSGLDGLVLKSRCVEAIVKSLELAMLGERVFPVEAMRPPSASSEEQSCHRAIQENGTYNMSSREIEVLKSLSKGLANKEIARHLGIMEPTVKVHVKAILRKSRTRNRTEAALWATGVGLVAHPSRPVPVHEAVEEAPITANDE